MSRVRAALAFVCILLSFSACRTPVVIPDAPEPTQRSNQILLRSTDGYDGEFASALANQGFIVQPIGTTTKGNTETDRTPTLMEPTECAAATAEPNDKDKNKEKNKNTDDSSTAQQPNKTNGCATNAETGKPDQKPNMTLKQQLRTFRAAGFEYELQLSITHDEHTACMLSDGHRVSVVMSVIDIDTNQTILVLKQVGADRECPPQQSVWEPLAEKLRIAWN